MNDHAEPTIVERSKTNKKQTKQKTTIFPKMTDIIHFLNSKIAVQLITQGC